jgi:hypothetical protein
MNRLFGRFDGDDDLDRVMLVRRNDLFTPRECGEAAIPQIAVWRAGPPRRGTPGVSRLAYASGNWIGESAVSEDEKWMCAGRPSADAGVARGVAHDQANGYIVTTTFPRAWPSST